MTLKGWEGVINRFLEFDKKVSDRIETIYYSKIVVSPISFIGSIYFSILYISLLFLAGYLLKNQELLKTSLLASLALLLSTIIVFFMKWTFKRKRLARPSDPLINKIDPYSFPSGHLARIGGFITTSYLYPVICLSFVIAAVITSFIRIKKRYHFFSDCAAGLFVGGICGFSALLWIDIVEAIAVQILTMR